MSPPGAPQGYYQGAATPPISMPRGFQEETKLLILKEDTKEYTIVGIFNNKTAALHFELIANGLNNDAWELLDLEAYQVHLNNVLRSMKIIKRYRYLHTLMPDLRCTHHEGFLVGDASFQTLDEVEKAIKNKAFL
jgi:hypothetical protein